MFDCEFVTGFVTESFKVVGVFEWVFMMYFDVLFKVAMVFRGCSGGVVLVCSCGYLWMWLLRIDCIVVRCHSNPVLHNLRKRNFWTSKELEDRDRAASKVIRCSRETSRRRGQRQEQDQSRQQRKIMYTLLYQTKICSITVSDKRMPQQTNHT